MKSERAEFGSSARLEFAGGTLVLHGIPLAKLDAWFGTVFWQHDLRIGAARCDAMCYPAVLAELQRRHIRFENDVTAWQEVRWKAESLHELRPEQIAAVDAWLEAGPPLLAQPGEHGAAGEARGQRHALAVEEEFDAVAHVQVRNG